MLGENYTVMMSNITSVLRITIGVRVMKNNVKSLVNVIIFALVMATSQQVFGYSSGINGYSGNPATNTGNTCATCHSGGVAPSINLSGPTVVRPGTINNYTLTISGGQQNSGGLDISASAGTLISTLANTKLQVGELTHTTRATAASDGTVSWNFSWQAPTTLGSYTIYSAGLSTNANSSTTGDGVANSVTAVTVSDAAPQPPTAVIHAPMTAQIGATVSFDGSASYDPDGIINQYQWNFGDGKTASGAHAINSYTTAGVYTITLTVTDSTNLTHTTFQDITVGGVMIPVADPGGPYNSTAGQAVNFDASLSTHVTAIVRYIWDFGDASPVVAVAIPAISHTFAQPGSYTVTLAVQDANNVTGIASTVVVINAVSPPPATDGATLYANNCASCHGPLATSTKLNRSATQITNAIAGVSQMSTISLTAAQVQAIATALVSVTPPPPSTDGATLYANNCASCHGPLATSSKLNRTATQIQNAINANAGGVMGSLSGLTSTQISAIATALAGSTPPPTTGEGLYNTYCLACHGPGGRGGQYKNVTGASTNEISSALSSVRLMNSITLSSSQIKNISDYLNGVSTPPPTTTDGPTLYSNNCASCHGPLASSSKLNRTAAQIQSAITGNAGGVMGSINLTSAQIQAIATALASSTTPPPPTTDGAALYGSYCQSCHGALATSAKLNRSAAQIQSAITGNAGGVMGSLSGLTSTQIQSIATALGSITPVPTTGVGLYNTYCSACHGAGGQGGTYESVRGASTSSITSAISGVPLMNSISLTPGQKQAIATYLSSGNGGGN